MKRLVIAIPDDLHAALKAYAAARGLSLSAFLKSALFSALYENPANEYLPNRPESFKPHAE